MKRWPSRSWNWQARSTCRPAATASLLLNLESVFTTLVAGAINLGLALSLGLAMPPAATLAATTAVGFFGYGLSIVLSRRAGPDSGGMVGQFQRPALPPTL